MELEVNALSLCIPHALECPVLAYPVLPAFLSACLSICLTGCLSARLSVRPSVCLSVSLLVCLSVCLSVCLFARLSVYPSVCLSAVCLRSGTIRRWEGCEMPEAAQKAMAKAKEKTQSAVDKAMKDCVYAQKLMAVIIFKQS